jgi:hypothetical protein
MRALARISLCLGLFSLPARGLAAPAVILLGDNSTPGVPATLREAAIRAVTASLGQLAGVELRRLLDPEARLTARLERLFAETRSHSERFEEKQALLKLAEAEQAFRAAFGPVPSVEPLARLLLTRVRILAELQREEDLRRDLERLLALDPGRSFDPAQYPPRLVKLWKKLQARGGKRRATLTVATVPPGLTVIVDGARRGSSPVTISLPPGEHFVAAGGSGTATMLGAEGGQLTLRATSRADLSWRREARELGASWALLCELEPASGGTYGLRLRLLSAAGTSAKTLSSRPLGVQSLEQGAAILCARLAALLGGRAGTSDGPTIATSAPSDPGPAAWLVPRPRRAPVWRRWWFWTAVGVAVAGGVATAVILTRERETRIQLSVER